ncbi:MAG TPA: PDGLE domain-containing protein [Methanothrix sp.]|nr:PDGLE domain-containing protein [Methanothrix sp.]
MTMDRTIKKLFIGLFVLAIFTPLGLLAVGETFGEWGPEEVKEKLGFVPPGLERLSSLWSAPLPDYAIPGTGDTMTVAAAAYILSAVIGVVVCAGLLYIVGRRVAKD